MRLFTYRGRQRLRRGGVVLAIVLAVAILGVVVSFQYLERFMVYDAADAHLVLPGDQTSDTLQAETSGDVQTELPEVTVQTLAPVERPQSDETTQEDAAAEAQAEAPMSGYYVTYDDLADPDAVLAAIQADADCNTVLIEVKSQYGTAYYPSNLVQASESVDTAAVGRLIGQLAEGPYRLIAMLPAYCDSLYALANQSQGLMISGGALWLDWDSYYWLDPASQTVQTHLVDLCGELQGLGFDEVAFSHFTFPTSQNIDYPADQDPDALLTASAELLIRTAALLDVDVSFCGLTDGPALRPSDGGHLFYVTDEGAQASQALTWLESLADETLTEQVVFCTGSHDTRFDGNPTLRPIAYQD